MAAAVLSAGVTAAALGAREQAAAPSARLDFHAEVRPILSDRCFACHGPDAAKRKARLRLDTPEGARKVVAPGDPEASELVRRISTDYADEKMPPPESRVVLSDAEKQVLRRWIAEGAEYRRHWALEPVRAVEPPASPGDGSSTNPIDAFVRARLGQEGLTPSRAAAPETRLRRLAFSLTGLPPAVAEIDEFLEDPSPAAYGRFVERYLASPAYGERMALDWLDLARYADTYGYQADVERDMSPWRDWVIRAFNQNLPYDQFLSWQIAGDLLPAATRDQRIATAFNRLHRQTNEGGSIDEEFRTEYVLDRVNTFGTAMLGLTLECARCHDHKFDPITQRDYYSLSAFFNSIDESGLYSHFTRATPSPSLLLWTPRRERQHAAVTARIAAAERGLGRIAADARSAFRAWLPAARVVGRTPVAHLAFDAVDDDTTKDAIAPLPARLQDGPRLVTDPATGGGALQFSGDNAVVHPGVREFRRTDPFSIAVRLEPTEHQARAIVLHQSRAWSDAGSRGFELTLERGRPFFALVHFWPGNAIAVRARDPLPLDAWSRFVVTYDGSSRASGLHMYVDGAPIATEVVRDRLYKDITYEVLPGEKAPPEHPFTIGARFRDSGFKNGLVDDVQVFDVELTSAEVAGTLERESGDERAFAYFLARAYAPYRDALAALRRLRAEENRIVAPVREMMVMEEMPAPRPAHLLARGAYDAPKDVAPRDTPASLPPFPADQPRNRLGLARWLTSPAHPLTARVAVNRIWQMHFGRGIVASAGDFGSQGGLPTHPQLIDYLADRFVTSGWDVKALHRLIVSSETFQQSSQATPELLARDPENLLLARGPRRRLLAEQVRDGALAASGLLVRTVGGPSVKPYQPDRLWEQSGTGTAYVPDTGDRLYRRSLYTFWKRTLPPPSMAAFDAPTRETCTARRETTTTPLQSLVLLNDPQFVEAARALAARLLARHPDDAAARHRQAFLALTGRPPDDTEAAILARAYEEQRGLFAADPGGARQLVAIGASRIGSAQPAAVLAAETMVVSAIMNFDEFVVVR
jgi:hypothetical protein